MNPNRKHMMDCMKVLVILPLLLGQIHVFLAGAQDVTQTTPPVQSVDA